MRNVKCIVAYDGSAYCGYQRQNGQPTIQEALEWAVERIFGAKTTVHASGRTDSGVHACGQVIHFRVKDGVPEDRIAAALNSVLPADIVILEARTVHDSFHARISAVQKTYEYYMLNRKTSCPFRRLYALHIPVRLDSDAMHTAALHLLGNHDFSSFQAAGSSVVHPKRTVSRSRVCRQDDMVIYTVTADGFLYNMVRIIVGTLIEVGRGKTEPDEMKEILQARCRAKAGSTAPPQGLFLKQVEYKDGLRLT